MSHNERLDEYKTDYLFLLVGTNPLPNYAAACLLAKENGKIYLLHSEGTSDTGKALRGAIQKRRSGVSICLEGIDETDSHKIEQKMNTLLENLDTYVTVGLNYTGGTKAMSVHVYRAIERKFKHRVFSYLDARTLSMRIDGSNEVSTKSIPVGKAMEVNVDELIGLHNRKVDSYEDIVQLTSMIEPLLQLHCAEPDVWREWCNKNLRKPDAPHKFKSKTDLKKVDLPLDDNKLSSVFSSVATGQTLATIPLPQTPKLWTVEDLAEWLDGKWLEHYVLYCVQKLMTESGLHDVAMSVKVKKQTTESISANFEFDIAITRGYQLFAISCTTDPKRARNKEKLIEAHLRARQIGGEEANVALVTCYSDQDNPKDPELKREIQENWFIDGRLEVFGREHLLTLCDHLKQWFATANR